jgi:hypothetical protein
MNIINNRIVCIKFILICYLVQFFTLYILFPYTSFAQVPVTEDKARIVLSAYAQTVPNDSYTFMGISHPSLDTALTQIGVSIEVRAMTTVPDTVAGQSSTFTINAGETHRVFIVNVTHPAINTSNALFNNSRTHLILTTDTAQFGNIRAVSVNESPITPTIVGTTNKYANLSQLIFWGVVYIESSATGFAMEFIGDAHDSSIGEGSLLHGVSGSSNGAARGIN